VITVQVQFKLTGVALPASREIRAVRTDSVVPNAKPLGDLQARTVKFNAAGESGWVTFNAMASVGKTVQRADLRWQWEARKSAPGFFVPFDNTCHRIYVTLTVPKSPWNQTPFDAANLQLPWARALDYSCSWAQYASNVNEAAGLVTEHVYALGPGIVTYDCPGGGSTHYAWPDFDLTAFIDRLGGGTGNGVYVNCTDCATFTSTFANLLGCDLWQSRMGWGFSLNDLLAIGSNVWQTACGWGGFSYHEVAWLGACTNDDAIWDACLQVDGNVNTGPPRLPVLPKNMIFTDYRALLVPAASWGTCNAQPATRKRRVIS
jgi:hypothetical protein